MSNPIYLDHNASTPIAPEVLETLVRCLRDADGNASSSHGFGRAARAAIERGRGEIAALLGADPGEIVITSGGTESNNAAIHAMAASAGSRRHAVVSAIEHPSVDAACRRLEADGWDVTRVPPGPTGVVAAEAVIDAFRAETAFVSLMHANNETGAIQPVAEVARAARSRGIVVHTDAAQSAGKIAVDARALGVDLLTIAGHKLYAPQGIGALFVRRGVPFEPFLRGAGHQGGRRAGTEPVALSAALGTACALASQEGNARAARLAATRDRLEAALRRAIPDLVVHAADAPRLPNTLYAAVPGVDAPALLDAVPGVAAGSGAACHSGRTEPSKVLLAMGVPREIARATVRLTTGRATTDAGIDAAAEAIVAAVRRLRPGAGA